MEFAKRATERLGRGHVLRTLGVIGLAVALAAGGLASGPKPVAASGKKVVVVVGPVGSATAYFKDTANTIAAIAKSYGANVTKVYTPYATWSRVKQVAYGANVLIYVGHGNGWPSPYRPFQTYTKDGMGLNAKSGGSNGSGNLKYSGERYLASELNLAKNSVVILMRLCYASGNSEPGRSNPTRDVAKARVDNYGAGFLRTGARAVFAQGLGSAGYIFKALYGSNKNMKEIFWSDPKASYNRISFSANRSPSWAHGEMDPYKPGRYYRSLIGDLSFTASEWR